MKFKCYKTGKVASTIRGIKEIVIILLDMEVIVIIIVVSVMIGKMMMACLAEI